MSLKEALSKFSFNLKRSLIGKATINENILNEYLENLYFQLLEENVCVNLAQELIKVLKNNIIGKEVSREEDIDNVVKKSLNEIFRSKLSFSLYGFDIIEKNIKEKPYKIIFFGINGSGKTLSIAKLGNYLKNKNFNVVFAAGDTFRAGSIEQLEKHGKALNIRVVKRTYGVDPSSVLYDAVEYAKNKNIDFVLADTSGRLPNNENLIRELNKMIDVFEPDLRVLVLDLTQGQDLFYQAELYEEKVGFDCFIFTKYDVDKKNNLILSLMYEFNKPLLFVGTGQNYNDFQVLTLDNLL